MELRRSARRGIGGLRRGGRTAASAVLLAGLLTGVGTAPASATTWALADGFEGGPWDYATFGVTQPGAAASGTTTTTSNARSGTHVG